MKTMLGGWDQNGFWAGERRAEAEAPVSVLRCVAVSPRAKAKPSAWQSQAPEVSRLPALKRTLQAPAHLPAPRIVAPEPFRHLARRQPPPLPSRWPAAQRRKPGAPAETVSARLARVALDATCELSEADLVVFAVPPAAPGVAGGHRRGATLLDPTPPCRRSRSRFTRWVRSWFSRAHRAR